MVAWALGVGMLAALSGAALGADDTKLALGDYKDEVCGKPSDSMAVCVMQSKKSQERYLQVITLRDGHYYVHLNKTIAQNGSLVTYRGSMLSFSEDRLDVLERTVELRAVYTKVRNQTQISGTLLINGALSGKQNFEMDTWLR